MVEEIKKEVYQERIPLMKEVVGQCLEKVKVFLETFNPQDITEVKALESMATGFNNMLRLETGKSTSNIAMQHYSASDAESLYAKLEELKKLDPVFSNVPMLGQTPEAIEVPSLYGEATPVLAEDKEDDEADAKF